MRGLPGNLGRRAIRIGTSQARNTIAASIGNPLDAHSIANLQSCVLCPSTKGSDSADALMAAHLALLRWSRKPCPGIAHNSEVAVTHSRVSQIDEDLADARFGGINFLDLRRDAAGVVVHQGLVPGRDLD